MSNYFIFSCARQWKFSYCFPFHFRDISCASTFSLFSIDDSCWLSEFKCGRFVASKCEVFALIVWELLHHHVRLIFLSFKRFRRSVSRAVTFLFGKSLEDVWIMVVMIYLHT